MFNYSLCCGIVSGEVPVDPVVSNKSGLLFEKRIVQKYIADGGKCPATGEDMNEIDLIAVKASKTVRPRSIAGNSIPNMIANFQNEWDEVMLETFNLKQHLDATRKELSQALYQHDAACRVIARLIKERDEARALLSARLSGGAVSSGTPAPTASSEMEVSAPEAESSDSSPPALGSSVIDAINAKCTQLSSTRKGRKSSEIPGLAAKDMVISNGFVSGASYTPHKSDKPGVACLAVGPTPEAGNQHILTGGVDKTALLIDASSGSVVSKLTGHSKKVSAVAFHPAYSGSQLDSDRLFTASADSTVKIWKPTLEKNKIVYQDEYTFKHHTNEVTGLAVHPIGSYAVSLSSDSSWAFLDLEECKVLTHMTNTNDGAYSCGGFHPDGLILATGCENSSVNIYDVRDQKRVVAFDNAHQGHAINTLAFSENGYIVATGAGDGCVKIWDLRKLKSTKTIESECLSSFCPYIHMGCALLFCSTAVSLTEAYLSLIGLFFYFYSE